LKALHLAESMYSYSMLSHSNKAVIGGEPDVRRWISAVSPFLDMQ